MVLSLAGMREFEFLQVLVEWSAVESASLPYQPVILSCVWFQYTVASSLRARTGSRCALMLEVDVVSALPLGALGSLCLSG